MKKLSALLLFTASATSALAGVTEYEVGPFDRIAVRGDFNVVYSANQDSIGYARFESDTDLTSALEVSNNNGRLQIKENLSDKHAKPFPTIYVYSDYIVGVENEGDGNLEADLKMKSPAFSAKLIGNGKIVCRNVNATKVSASIATGNGTIVLSGAAVEANYSLTGSGVIQADALVADEIDCKVLGTGSIGCNPVELLDVRGAGTTKVYYTGNPKINKVGGAKIIRMQPETEVPTVVTAGSEE